MNRLYKELKIKSSLKSLVEVEKFVEEICEIYSINNSYYGNILLAIEEASKNAILHGNSSDIRKNVLITFQNSPGGLCFTIEDEGAGFNHCPLAFLHCDRRPGPQVSRSGCALAVHRVRPR